MPTTVRDMIKRIEKVGWYQIDGGKGSHRKFVHPTRLGIIVVPGQLYDELAPGTENNIRKIAGIK